MTGLGDEDLDVAVFRFTLGIPGFDDSNIPRVVGAGIAALVAINHVLGAQPAPPAQVRAEFLDILLAVLCFTAPELEGRLRQVGPGRGRAQAGEVAGAAQVFALAEGLTDNIRKELAWASFALLKNVNCCTVLLFRPLTDEALLARGSIAKSMASATGAAASLKSISQALGSSSGTWVAAEQQQQQRWLPDRSAMQQAGLSSCSCVPEGVQSALVQPVGDGAVLLVLAERPRQVPLGAAAVKALSDKDRKWVAAIASKLSGALLQA
eukprot:gene9832-9991_t